MAAEREPVAPARVMRRHRLAASAALAVAALGILGAAPAAASVSDPADERATNPALAPAALTADGRLQLAVVVPITVPASATG